MTIISTPTAGSGADAFDFSASSQSLFVTSTGALVGGVQHAGVADTNQLQDDNVLNAGTITGTDVGVIFEGENDYLDNQATGTITGSGNGVSFWGANGSATNSGYIAGPLTGVFADNVEGATSDIFALTNFGRITGSTAIELSRLTSATVSNTGTIYGAVDGILASKTPDVSVDNSGDIHGNVTFASGSNNYGGNGGTLEGNLTGGTGADTFDLSHQTVTGSITGGGGADTIAFASASAGFTIDLGDGTAYGAGEAFTFTGFEQATGSAFADTITGDDAGNYIVAGAGNDVINAGSGNDVVLAGPGIDTVLGGPGNDTLYGNGGADMLQGNGGADSLIGGAGADTLTGGAGADTFFYQLATDSPTTAPDLITDFVHGTDKIDLSGLHLASASEIKITSSGGMTYVAIDTNNDGTADMQINLTGANVLTVSDIVGIPASATAAHAATAAAIAHHELVASLHAASIDHGIYG